MNLDEIKNRLNKLNNKGGGGSSDYKNNFWRPPVGEKSQVRLVPYAHNKDFPFIELYFYFGIGKPRMIALTNFYLMYSLTLTLCKRTKHFLLNQIFLLKVYDFFYFSVYFIKTLCLYK